MSWLSALLLVAGLAAQEPAVPAASELELPPAQGLARVSLPPVQQGVLPGGAALWTLSQPASPLVAVEIVVTLPSDRIGERSAHALRLLPRVIDAGARGAPHGGLDAQLEPLGASVLIAPGDAGLRSGLLAPPEGLAQALEITAKALARPACRRRVRARAVTELEETQARVSVSSGAALRWVELQRLYPPAHPSAPRFHDGGMGRRELLSHHRALLEGGGATVIFVGPVGDPERDLAARSLAFLGPPPPEKALPPARLESDRHPVWRVPVPGARSLVLSVSWPVPAELGWAEAQLLADALGGGATARLDRRLREELGLVYGARARLEREPGHGRIRVSTRIPSAWALEGVRALREELTLLRFEPAELERARATRLFALARQLDGAEASAAALAELALLGMEPAERQGELDALSRLDPQPLGQRAPQLLDPAAALWVIAGDPEAVLEVGAEAGLGPSCEFVPSPHTTAIFCEED